MRVRSMLVAMALGTTAVGVGVPRASASSADLPAGATPDMLTIVTTGDDAVSTWSELTYGVSEGDLEAGGATRIFAGQFGKADGGDLFIYNPGPGRDSIETHFDMKTADGEIAGMGNRPETVNGTYAPIVGDFDGTGTDDILWYAPGSGSDSLWLYRADGSHKVLTVSVSGRFRPVVLDVNHDDRDDIVWYGAGSSPDSLWLFGAGASHTTKAISIDGTYALVPGPFGLVFFNAQGPDSVWQFDGAGNHTSVALPGVDGAYRPIEGQFLQGANGNIYLYGPGGLPEKIWAFGVGGVGDVSLVDAPQITGTYTTAVGDFDSNGLDDLALVGPAGTKVWEFESGGGHATVSLPYTNTGALVRVIEQR